MRESGYQEKKQIKKKQDLNSDLYTQAGQPSVMFLDYKAAGTGRCSAELLLHHESSQPNPKKKKKNFSFYGHPLLAERPDPPAPVNKDVPRERLRRCLTSYNPPPPPPPVTRLQLSDIWWTARLRSIWGINVNGGNIVL